MRRRELLSGALAALLWPALGAGCARGDPPALARALTGELASDPAVRALGRRYLRQAPREADPAALVAALCGAWSERERRAPAEQLRARLSRQARDDFASGRRVEIDGWWLSRTEARIVALAALR